MNAISFYRLVHWLYCHKIPLLPKFLQFFIFLFFNSYIPNQKVIGSVTQLDHRGIGVGLGVETKILGDISIGESAIVATHAVVIQDTLARFVAIGVPAKKLPEK